MSIETEIKVRIEDVDDFCRQLGALNPDLLSARHFEDNLLLDFPDQKLQSARCLLRIRFAGGEDRLTFKGPSRNEGIFKIREELETRIEDGSTLLQVLERIGMRIGFRYQKYRTEYTLDNVHVAVDETPIGNYVEFEGSENGILGLARRMGIGESQFVKLSYYSLYMEYCRIKCKEPEFMVF